MPVVVNRTEDETLIKAVFNSNGIREALSTDQPLDTENFKMDPYAVYLLATNNSKVVGLFTLRHWSTFTAEVHLVVLKKYWGTGISDEMTQALIENLRVTSTYRKLITHAPAECKQVLETAKRKGAELVGIIKDGTRFNGKPTDIHILSFNII